MMRSILLVDDNPMDVELTQRAFQRSRLTNPMVVARDGEEALAWIPRREAGEPKPVDFAKFCEVAGRIRFYWSVLNVPAS